MKTKKILLLVACLIAVLLPAGSALAQKGSGIVFEDSFTTRRPSADETVTSMEIISLYQGDYTLLTLGFTTSASLQDTAEVRMYILSKIHENDVTAKMEVVGNKEYSHAWQTKEVLPSGTYKAIIRYKDTLYIKQFTL